MVILPYGIHVFCDVGEVIIVEDTFDIPLFQDAFKSEDDVGENVIFIHVCNLEVGYTVLMQPQRQQVALFA